MPSMSTRCFPEPDGWSMDELARLLEGQWYRPPAEGVRARRFAITHTGIVDERSMFIAIDKPTWLAGSRNTGVYADWDDTHLWLANMPGALARMVVGAIVQRPVENAPESLPQLVVKNSYDCIKKLAAAAREGYDGKIVAITGTVGKSTTKNMLAGLIEAEHSVVSTLGNHNTRTGVPLTMTALKTRPEFCVLEVAQSALWMTAGGICKLVKPHIGVITEIGVGQTTAVRTTRETARYKARICEGIQPGGHAVLNSEMAEYAFIVEEVRKFGATPISYGHSPSADARILSRENIDGVSRIHADILGEELRYNLPLPGQGMAMNSVAVLTVLKLLGFDIARASQGLMDFKQREAVQEWLRMPVGTGFVDVMDDSYSAEILSMQEAASVIQDCNPGGRRQIALLARIVNLSDETEELHGTLAEPFMAAGFDRIFAHGWEMEGMLKRLPSQRTGGLFSDATSLVAVVADYLRPDDIVLIKGDRRDSDFGSVRHLLAKVLENRASASFLPTETALCPAVAFSPDSGARLRGEGSADAFVAEGLGGVLLIHLVLDLLFEKRLTLSDSLAVGPEVARERTARNALGLAEGESVSLERALSAFAATGAPDAGIALAEHIRLIIGESTLARLSRTAEAIGLNPRAVRNITGRRRPSAYQQYNLLDIQKAAMLMFSLPDEALRPLAASGSLPALQGSVCTLGFGYSAFNAIVLAEVDGRRTAVAVCGAQTAFERDYAAARLLSGKTDANPCPPPVLRTGRSEAVITLCGDTYFGEWYTRERLKKGREDALFRYGYRHSFGGVAPFLEQSDVTVVNFEAVLTDKADSPVREAVEFVLRGDPRESVAELKRRNVHAVSLANNHAMDYGSEGLEDMLSAFRRADIRTFGAGVAACEAEEPLLVRVGEGAEGRTIFFIAAYWYTASRHANGYYAFGDHAGTACIHEPWLRKIAACRAEHPEALIVAVAHWGMDFVDNSARLRPMAERIIACGADMILGHGSHTISSITRIMGKPVIWSVGNFVFNSNGDGLTRQGVLPYGYICRLLVGADIALRLYPIHTYNPDTFWQPQPVSSAQWEEVASFLRKTQTRFTAGQDELGRFLSVPWRED